MTEFESFETASSQLDELSEAVRDETLSSVSFSFPTLASRLEEVCAQVRENKFSGVVIIDGSSLSGWERQFGASTFELLMSKLSIGVESLRGKSIDEKDIVCVEAKDADSIIVFLSTRNRTGESVDLENTFDRIQSRLFHTQTDTPFWFKDAADKIGIGSAIIVHNQSVDPKREVYRAIRSARLDAQANLRETRRKRHRIIGEMIAQSSIQTLYQPICHLADERVFGYEALNRPHEKEAAKLGIHLFIAAAHAELDGELDHACRALSVNRRPKLDERKLLFVNCLPETFIDLRESLDFILESWESDGLLPGQLVFELTENMTIEQLSRIQPNLHMLRERGYRFAIDDVGTGATNLQLIAELEPDFIKMDISLTRGVGTSERKRALASFLLDMSIKAGAQFIAEGIENPEDLEALRAMGVPLGQGYLLGYPSPNTSPP